MRELFDRLHDMVASAGAELSSAVANSRPKDLLQSCIEKSPDKAATGASSGLFMTENAPLPDTVRVATSKLAAVLLGAEELITAKAAATQRLVELYEISGSLSAWERDWRKVRLQVPSLQRSDDRNSRAKHSGEEKTALGLGPVQPFLERNERFLQSITGRVGALGAALESDRHLLDRRISQLLEDIKAVSMLPFSALLGGLPKVVRDLCRDCGKDAELVVKGGDIEVGRKILDEIKDPLIHLVRNCIDHGIEPAAERQRQGKPTRATLAITITPKTGGRVELSIADDGAGINTERVLAAAAKQGLVPHGEQEKTEESATIDLIFQSGVSTSPMLTAVSGRGLGLAIVREKVQGLGGEVAVETQPGLGTTFRLTLPLTVATFRGILVRASQDLFVMPTMYVRRALRVDHEAITSLERRTAVQLNGRTVSLVWLSEVLGVTTGRLDSAVRRRWPGVLLEWASERIVFLVDEVLGDQEVLVKGLGKQLHRVRNIAGAVVLENGQIAPVLNVADLMRSAALLTPAAAAAEVSAKPKSVLVAEDSITARTLLKGVLESAGYAVTTAVNGADAYRLLEAGDFDLVVSDIEMPQMSGFELTAKIRGNRKLADVPVILVTALDSREDRERGADVGANAYILKSSFEQSDLLEVVQRLV